MIDTKKKVQAAKDYASKSYRTIRRISKNCSIVQRDKNAAKHFLNGIDWAEKEIFKDLFHPASKVPRNDNGKVLAFSKEFGNRKLYDMNAMLDETDCYTYQDMWENEVNKYRLSDWIFVEELFDLIIKGGE